MELEVWTSFLWCVTGQGPKPRKGTCFFLQSICALNYSSVGVFSYFSMGNNCFPPVACLWHIPQWSGPTSPPPLPRISILKMMCSQFPTAKTAPYQAVPVTELGEFCFPWPLMLLLQPRACSTCKPRMSDWPLLPGMWESSRVIILLWTSFLTLCH